MLKTLLNKYLHKLIYFACFVDFSKAFESVWRQGFFKKLPNIGVNGNIFDVCILQHSFHLISNLISSDKGVKQDDSLSTTFFNIYINDLCQILMQVLNMTLYIWMAHPWITAFLHMTYFLCLKVAQV